MLNNFIWMRLFLRRAPASFLRRHFLAAEEWFRAANLDAFRLEERSTNGIFSECMSQLEVLGLSGEFLGLLRHDAIIPYQTVREHAAAELRKVEESVQAQYAEIGYAVGRRYFEDEVLPRLRQLQPVLLFYRRPEQAR